MGQKWILVLGLMWGSIGWAVGQDHVLQVYDTQNSPLPDNHVRTLTIAPDSTLWVGTENGLVTLKNSNWSFVDTLAGYQIRAIAFDTSGYAWVGTFLNGLWVQNDTGWVNHTTANSTLPDNYVRTIAFCPNGDAWLGTVGGAVHISNGTWTVYRQNNTNWYTEHIASSYCSPTNAVWLGGINSGLMHQVDTGWTIYRNLSSGLPDNTILDIKATADGDLWLAMPAAGAAVFDGGQGWLYYSTITSFNPSNSINHIAVGQQGRVYLASTNKGVVVYKGGLDWFHLSSTVRPDTSGTLLPSNEIITVVQDGEGILWAGTTNAGLLRIEFLDTTTAVPMASSLGNIQLYPNPAKEYIIVSSPTQGLGITLMDLLGRVLYETVSHAPETKIALSSLPSGTYIVHLQSGNSWAMYRVVKD